MSRFLQHITYVLSIPKIASESPITSYIQYTSLGGARVDASHLVKPEQRKLANTIRKVEDPVAVKAKAAEVSTPLLLVATPIFYEENLSQRT